MIYKLNKKDFFKREALLLILLIGSFFVGILLYPQLPDQVPSHWNIRGEIDGYASRFWGAYGMPLLNLAIYLGMLLLPNVDPKKKNYALFSQTYYVIRLTLHLFFMALYVVTLLAALGYAVNTGLIVRIGVGILFIILGNYMGRVRHNYFVGIKTPWTLASEKVWQKTHRLGGILFVVGGMIMIITAFIPGSISAYIGFAAMIAAAFIPLVYSYVLYKKEQ